MTERAKKLLLLYYKQSRKIRRVSGLPPLTFKAKKAGTLKNYRIYGQTVDGESVGDRTGNLFGRELTNNIHLDNTTGLPAETTDRVAITTPIPINTDTYCLNFASGSSISVNNLRFMYSVFNGSTLIRCVAGKRTGETIDASSGDLLYIAFYGTNNQNITSSDISNIMLNTGSAPLSYEPYGYKVPVTVEGKNLFDYSTVTTGYRIIWATGQPAPDATATISDYIAVNSGTYAVNSKVFVACYDSSKNYLGVYSANGYVKDYSPSVDYIVLNSTCSYIRIFSYNISGGGSNTISQTTMLNAGSTPLPYEPYRTPVTTSLYLPEPIKMVGDEAEYIDYAEQKFHRISGADLDVTLPALPVLPGTNVLSVGTEVQPSDVEISGRIKAAGG